MHSRLAWSGSASIRLNSYVWHDSFTCVNQSDSFICMTWLMRSRLVVSGSSSTRLIHMCDITRSCVWHDSFIGDGRAAGALPQDSFICVTWLVHTCDTTHSYVSHGSFICVTWLIHTCDTTRSNMYCDSFKCMTWLIHMWKASRIGGWRAKRALPQDLLIRAT